MLRAEIIKYAERVAKDRSRIRAESHRDVQKARLVEESMKRRAEWDKKYFDSRDKVPTATTNVPLAHVEEHPENAFEAASVVEPIGWRARQELH
eukprot:4283329-Amphidinium_carterae.1